MREETDSTPVILGAKKTGRLIMIGVMLLALLMMLLAGCAGVGRFSRSAPSQPGADDRLVGKWLGPMPGNAGKCGTSNSEFVFQQNSDYSVANQSQDCGTFTLSGVYEVRTNTIYFHQRAATQGVQQQMDYPVQYRFESPNALMLRDEATGRWLTYYRQ